VSKAGKAIEVTDVSVSYGGVRAVDEATFSVPNGAIVGFIGPNGAGKTTVFDAICGFVSAEGGRVVIDGTDMTNMTPTERARRGLGRSFQDARLFGSLTVAETLACAFERHTKRWGSDPVSAMIWFPVRKQERSVQARVDDIIDLMGLGAFRDKFVNELSTGSRRVVDLACVIAHEPTVLLLDEPSSGMAQRETEAMGPLLLKVKEATGCTMLLIEHDMPLVTSVSDELIALETGRVIMQGKPHDVTNDPRVVEAYLGTDERVVARSGAITNGRRKRKPPVRTAKPKATKAKAKPQATKKKKAPVRKATATRKAAAKRNGARKTTRAKR
jgi:branched-chain amino acid transport system ATP-binding protein